MRVCPCVTSGAPGRLTGVFSCIQVATRSIDSAVPVSSSVMVIVVMPSSVSDEGIGHEAGDGSHRLLQLRQLRSDLLDVRGTGFKTAWQPIRPPG